MLKSRRNMLKTITGAAGVIVMGTWAYSEARGLQKGPPNPLPSPNAPSNQNIPAGMDGPDIIHPSKAAPNPLNQEQIAASVEQLYKLASELKAEVEHTNLTTTFSLDFVKKAQQIEKLAKQIKEKAKG
jgi:hypothetical protein